MTQQSEHFYGLFCRETDEIEFTSWDKASCYRYYVKTHIVPIFDREYKEIKHVFGVKTIEELYPGDDEIEGKLDEWMNDAGVQYIIIRIPNPK
jgi:hypothetical protein